MTKLRKFYVSMLPLLLFMPVVYGADIIPSPKIFKQSGRPKHIEKIIHRESKDQRHDYYKLTVKNGTAVIEGNIRYGTQTLHQLGWDIPDTYIEDWATFPLRGFMHDVGRNFRQVDMILEDLEYIAKYKLNVFHFHLTDNPAWRIECRCHPELNDPKFQRKGRDEGSFYTYRELHQIIEYARTLGITVIPEIDMPGHSKYFTDTFGCTMDSPKGREILTELLAEFFGEITADECPYFHIGSDEIHIEDKEGFMRWAENEIRKYDRQTIAWDPGLPADSTTIRQIWRESDINDSGKFLDSWVGYLNYYDPISFVQRAFLHKTSPNALGGILCLWNDVRSDDKRKICPHNGMETGVMAFAERMWNGGGYDCNPDLVPSPDSDAGMALAQFEKKIARHVENTDREIRWAANSKIPWTVYCSGDTISAWGGAVNLDMLTKIKEPTVDCRAETEIFVESDTTIYALAGFEAAARSNRISGGIGPQGKFENNGRIWIEGKEIFPSVEWKEPGKYHFEFNTWHRPEEELPYTDEQFYWMRQPVRIPLHQGWNRITLSTPKTFAGQRWTFAFIPVTLHPDGKISEATGIKFR